MNKYFKACEEEISVQSESFEEIAKVFPGAMKDILHTVLCAFLHIQIPLNYTTK